MRRLAILFGLLALAGAVTLGLRASDRWPQIVSLYRNAMDHTLDVTALAGLRLDALTVQGRVNTDAEDILAAIDVERGTPTLSIDVAETREALESLPWVKSAQVERQLPGAVHVVIQEREAYALWQRGQRYTLIDKDGHAIADVPGQIGELPLIVGADAPAHAFELFEALKTTPDLLARVRGAVRIGERRWNIHFDSLDNGITVRLPESGIAEAWARLADLQGKHNILGRDLTAIDLRLADRLVVQMNQPTATTPQAKTKTTETSPSAAKSAKQDV
jgi:cell division protein FtsQ